MGGREMRPKGHRWEKRIVCMDLSEVVEWNVS